jgi:type IV secretion system protein TrbL
MAVTQPKLLGLLGITLNPVTLAKDVVAAIAHAASAGIAKGAAAIVAALLGFVTTTSDPLFSGGWWSTSGIALFERVTAVTGAMLALAFMLSLVTAVLSGDKTMLSRAVLRLPIAVIEIALVVAVTAALVTASDQIAAEIAKGATGALSKFVELDMVGAVASSGVVGVVSALLVILAALAIWAELIVRSALIYLVVLAAPLVFAAGVHPSVGHLKRRYVEGALALIASKIVVALAFATGAAMLSGLASSPSFAAAIGALLEALAILGVAAFAPFILLRLFLGGEAILAAEGLARRPARAALATSGAAQSAAGFSSMLRRLGPNSSPPGGASPTSPSGGGGSGGPKGGGPPIPGGTTSTGGASTHVRTIRPLEMRSNDTASASSTSSLGHQNTARQAVPTRSVSRPSIPTIAVPNARAAGLSTEPQA